MPPIKPLIVVMLAIGLIFWPLRKHLYDLIPARDFEEMAKLVAMGTLAAFLAPGFWVYIVALVVLIRKATERLPPHESRPAWRVTLWFLLLMMTPNIPVVPPTGVYLMNVDHSRMLTWLLLLPALLEARRQQQQEALHHPTHKTPIDAMDVAMHIYFWGMCAILAFMYGPSFTAWLRQVAEWWVDIYLPYWGVRFAFSTHAQIRRTLAGFCLFSMVLCLVSIPEMTRGWPIYGAIQDWWGEAWGLSIYLMRDGMLRAQTSTGHSLAFGFAMATATGLWLWLYRFTRQRWVGWLGMVVLLAGVGTALSRATWLSAGLMMLLFTALSGQVRHIMLALTGSVAVFSVLAAVVPAFQELINKLPIIGNPEAVAAAAAASPEDDKEYRQAIFEGALELIKDNLLFGLPNAISYLEYLKQGQGIVDIVNSYIGIALNFGMTGLLPFVAMFIIALVKMWRLRQRLDPGMDGWYLANSMIATLLTIMVMIFSTSSISIIPYIYYALLALAVNIEKIYSEPEYEPDRDVVIYRPPPFPRYAS